MESNGDQEAAGTSEGPGGPDSGLIHVPFEMIHQGYQRQVAELTRRAIIAEAQVGVLQQQNALQRQMLEMRRANQS